MMWISNVWWAALIKGIKCFSDMNTLLFLVSAVSLLKDLKHANIVTLHDIVHTDKSLTLVFEYLVRLSALSHAEFHIPLICLAVKILNWKTLYGIEKCAILISK